MTDIIEPPPKRMRVAYHHRHKLQYAPQDLPPKEPSLILSEAVDKLLVDGIKAICEEEGLKRDIYNPVIESVALESLRNAAEEFMLQLCAKVRRSMAAARRTAPIGSDFDSAYDVLDLPRPDDQLQPYKTEPRINPSLLPTPPPEDPFHNHVELSPEFLGPDLSKQDDLKKFVFNTASLPPLPSAHTYNDSYVFSERETDARKIRELATEEGKLGEQALRKLAAAVKLETVISTEPDARILKVRHGRPRRKPALTEEAVFEETMRELLKSETDQFELGPIVTSEKMYRMPDDVRAKRKPAAVGRNVPSLAPAESTSTGKYNLLPPPLPLKRKSTSTVPAAMDTSFEL